MGGGVIGLEYAAMMTALNTRVTLIDQRPTLLDFADREVIESLCHHLREEGVTEESLARVRAPIGLDIGAETPARRRRLSPPPLHDSRRSWRDAPNGSRSHTSSAPSRSAACR